MSALTICPGDNLATLQALADAGTRFDLVELDGPYGAGLEAWDTLTPDEYLAHYTERLALVRRVLQPWGVVFVFGYPEMVALIRAWAEQTSTFYLRRWLTWYVQSTAHAGRRVQTIAVFIQPLQDEMLPEFRLWLQARRRVLGLTVEQAHRLTGIRAYARGGRLWFESDTCPAPTALEYARLDEVFDIPTRFDGLRSAPNFDGITDIDFLTVPVERATSLNDAGLRSKPLGLYETLFRPVLPPRPDPSALILYGGSGNAAIAAGQLGYIVTCCEADAGRCEGIRRAWAAKVDRRDVTPHAEYGPLFATLVDVA